MHAALIHGFNENWLFYVIHLYTLRNFCLEPVHTPFICLFVLTSLFARSCMGVFFRGRIAGQISDVFYADVERCLSIFMNFSLSCFLFRTTCDENVLESGSASPARRPLLAALTFTGKPLSRIESIYLSS